MIVRGAVAATDPLNSGAGKTFEMFKALCLESF